jgi:hypothetical protein
MDATEPSVGPLQLLLVGFETTERFRGHIAREILELRGRGIIRVLDARLLHRAPDGELTDVDLNPILAEPPDPTANPVARLLGTNGAGGNGGLPPDEAFGRTVGFALEDVRRLTDEIGPGDYAAVVLVEHVWASRLRTTVRDAGGALLAQGFLTPEVVMIVGAELQARADAEVALELAQAARGSALVEALDTIASRKVASAEDRVAAAAQVVRVLVADGFVHEVEAADAIEALATAGLLEAATVQAAIAEAEDMLVQRAREPPSAQPD